MTLSELIYSQAALLAGELEERQTELLKLLCTVAASSLAARLREGLTPEDCKADFIAAASLYALGALDASSEESDIQEFKAGDLTVKQASTTRDTASRCLQRQADMLIGPYLKDCFSFTGV